MLWGARRRLRGGHHILFLEPAVQSLSPMTLALGNFALGVLLAMPRKALVGDQAGTAELARPGHAKTRYTSAMQSFHHLGGHTHTH